MSVTRVAQAISTARLDAIKAKLEEGTNPPYLCIYAGTMPSSVATAAGTPLITMDLNDPIGSVVYNVAGNTLTFSPPTPAIVSVAGTATWARFFSGNGEAVLDVDVSDNAGTATYKISSVDFVQGAQVSLATATIND